MIAHLAELVGEIAHQPLHVDLAQHRRRLAHHHGAQAERLQHQPHLGELVGALRQAARAVLADIDDLGQEQRLALHAVGLQLILQALVRQPLVGGVLIDDHHALVGLGDDIGLVQLGTRHAQRVVLAVAVGCLGGSVDARRRRIERRHELHRRFGEAARHRRGVTVAPHSSKRQGR